MTAAEPLKCGSVHPGGTGGRCTRPFGHDGGHLDEVKNLYWQAAEPASPLCRWHGGEGPGGGRCGACRDEAAARQTDSRMLNETRTTAAGAL